MAGITVLFASTNAATLAPEKFLEVIAAAVRDVSEREKNQLELKRSEARLREAHKLADLGAWEVNLATQESWWSEQTYCIYGIEPGTRITMQTFLDAVHPAD